MLTQVGNRGSVHRGCHRSLSESLGGLTAFRLAGLGGKNSLPFSAR